MNRWSFLLIPVIALVLVGEAWADAMPFFSNPRTQIQVSFANLEKYPEYDFYVKFGVGEHTLSDYVKVKTLQNPANCATLHAWGRGKLGPMYLVAVPRGQETPGHSELRGKLDWLITKIPGTLQSEQMLGPEGFLSEAENNYEVDYRVHIDRDVLTVVFLQARKPFSIPWFSIAGMMLLVSLATVVIIRRRRSNYAGPSSTAETH